MADNDHSQEPPPLRGKMVRGVVWMVAMRWSIRLIGLVNTAILARLLEPSDFGIIAMCMLVIGLVEVFSYFGVDNALIHFQDPTREHWNSAWTFRILEGVAVVVILLAATPLAKLYFNEPRVATVLPLLSVGVLLQSFANIGTVAFRRELDFARDFRFEVLRKLFTVATTILLALLLRNFWALAFGIVIGRALGTGFSYLAHSYRPRFCVSRFKEIWSFSKWLFVANTGTYVLERSDKLIVGGALNSTAVGWYSVSSDLADMPTGEIVAPVRRALFPGFSRLRDAPERLAASFLASVGAIAAFAIPAGLGISLCAPYLVPILLGDRWTATIPILRVLAIYGVFRAMYGLVATLFVGIGEVRLTALMLWLQAIVMPCVLWVAVRKGELSAVAISKSSLAFAIGVLWFLLLFRKTLIRPRDVLARLWRSVVAGLLMMAGTTMLQVWFPESALFGLLATIASGAILYMASLLLLWRLAGRPAGAEDFYLEMLESKLQPLAGVIRRWRGRPPAAGED